MDSLYPNGIDFILFFISASYVDTYVKLSMFDRTRSDNRHSNINADAAIPNKKGRQDVLSGVQKVSQPLGRRRLSGHERDNLDEQEHIDDLPRTETDKAEDQHHGDVDFGDGMSGNLEGDDYTARHR